MFIETIYESKCSVIVWSYYQDNLALSICILYLVSSVLAFHKRYYGFKHRMQRCLTTTCHSSSGIQHLLPAARGTACMCCTGIHANKMPMHIKQNGNKSSGLEEKPQGLFRCRSWLPFPVATLLLTTISNSSSKRSDPLFCPAQTPGMSVIHRHTRRENTHTYKWEQKTNLKETEKV